MMPETNRPRKVDEAVASAFDRAGLESSSYLHPELLAQITRNVIKQLQSGDGLGDSTSVPPRFPRSPFPPPPVQQPTTPSPSTASKTSSNIPNRACTPPSPQEHFIYRSHTSPQSQSGYLPNELQSPREHESAHFSPPRGSPPQSLKSDSSDRVYRRPRGPLRLSTSEEITTLERIWGQLFDEDSHPTIRLGQLLRGLAAHIIEDYEPRHSIVITPKKMVKYYEDVKLANELYPWSIIFDDEHSSISRMYRDLGCQHHLVQDRYDERPDIPGLTPVGFERWVTLLIQAHPEKEFARLQKTVVGMPISNPDDRKERFPKEMSPRLFPTHEDRKIRERIEDSIWEHTAVEIPRYSSQEEPEPHHDSQPHTPSIAEQIHVARSHRSRVSFDLPTNSTSDSTYKPSYSKRGASATNDTNAPMPHHHRTPSNAPESPTKPYSALPGGGTQFEDDGRPKYPTKLRSQSIANSAPKSSRSDSTARALSLPLSEARTMGTRDAEVHHHHHAPNNAGHRHRGLSFSRGKPNQFRGSNRDGLGYQPGIYTSD